MKSKKKILLLDAHSIIHRAYHAMPEFSNSKGEPTGALYGLVSMLVGALKEFKPDFVVAAYDLPEKTVRHEMFEGYKAGRKKADEDLVRQIKKSQDLLEAFSIPQISMSGYEADDVLGTLAEKLKKKHDVIIASGDLDMLQLVDDKRVRVFTLKRSVKDTVIYDEEAVKARYGFGPEYVVDFKALKGDPSDNIPGVRGVGEKTAASLINAFGHLEQIYDALEKDEEKFKKHGFKERVLKLLKEGKDEAFFSKALASINKNLPIDFKMPSKSWKESLEIDKAEGFLRSLEFRVLMPRFMELFESAERSAAVKALDTDSKRFKETAIALWLVRSDIVDPSPEDIFSFAGTRDFEKAEKIIFKTLKERELTEVYEKIEKPLIPVVDKLNRTGIKLDTAFLKELSEKYGKELNKLKKEIHSLVGKEFNVNSPLQLARVLFEDLKITAKGIRKTSSGRYSTQESELEKIKDSHPVVPLILKHRELAKLLTTYVDNLPEMVSSDGRLRTRFIQAGTSTGRMASQNPNLQNIPIKSELGKAVRRAFIAEKGYSLLSLDYSQIELRIAAILSGDEKLIEIFKRGDDVHSAVASEIFDVPLDKVSDNMRRKAKVINFGILYGMGVNALRANLGEDSDTKEAREFLNKYFEKYPALAEWIDKTKSEVARKGYSQTLFGRRRYFDGINSDIAYIRSSAERMAINAPIQGTQADIIKSAMHKTDSFLSENLEDADSKIRLVLQIHDELIYEVKDENLDFAEAEIKKIMESVLPPEKSKSVPIVVKSKYGKNWGEL